MRGGGGRVDKGARIEDFANALDPTVRKDLIGRCFISSFQRLR